jgi:tetratricopeptide (TPR) repeat protein
MLHLSDELHEQIQRLCAEGDDLMDQARYEDAVACFSSAWELLPSPRTDWDAAIWILAAIADAHFQRGDFAAMRKPLMTAMQCDGAMTNPFLRLRLGQCLFELGELDEATNWLAGAFLQEGIKVFAADDPKYLVFIKSKLSPPTDGWPEGW